MSGGLAPSKSTVYVSNLPFSLTNNDLHKVFEKYGKVVKVTIVRDRETRKSKGVAFVLYLERTSAYRCVQALNNQEFGGRTLKCNIAKDNGRAKEFIKRKDYLDKTRCYECGEVGHLSYKCPKNLLGEREPPKKKDKRKKKKEPDDDEADDCSEVEDEEELDSLSAAIRFQQEKVEEEEYRLKVVAGDYTASSSSQNPTKKFKKSAYFSDEEEEDEAA